MHTGEYELLSLFSQTIRDELVPRVFPRRGNISCVHSPSRLSDHLDGYYFESGFPPDPPPPRSNVMTLIIMISVFLADSR